MRCALCHTEFVGEGFSVELDGTRHELDTPECRTDWLILQAAKLRTSSGARSTAVAIK